VARTVSLAAALSRREERDFPAAIAVSWITEWTPMQGSGAFKPGPVERWVPKVTYSEVELNQLGGWIERVQSADIGRISIAVDRILRAIFEVEAAESLIDAVIAWENLFGSRIETVYKVTASLAVLCEDDPAKRITFRKELDKLYEERSRLVHGDKAGAAFEVRNRAIQIGLEAIARLIEKRPDLLEFAKSSKRADRLLLSVDD
jgi:Apea-like HEPN